MSIFLCFWLSSYVIKRQFFYTIVCSISVFSHINVLGFIVWQARLYNLIYTKIPFFILPKHKVQKNVSQKH